MPFHFPDQNGDHKMGKMGGVPILIQLWENKAMEAHC
jgi:hypothetical protein